jgi:flagellar hook-associated protein 1 FlgK
LRSRLDNFVGTLVGLTNTVHRQGYTLTGQGRTDFFDPSGTTAATLALAPGIVASTDGIAAAETRTPGDGANALRLASLSEGGVAALDGRSLRQYFMDIADTVGIDVRNASQDVSIHQTLMDQADAQRSAVSGVSLDEEMVILLGQQQAYTAAARLISMADEMMKTLLEVV